MIGLYHSPMKDNKKQGKLAELLYQEMMKRNMSVQALASAVEVQRQTCYAWLHEKQKPSLDMLRRLSLILNIPFGELVATVHADVDGARLESLVQVYLNLSEESRDTLETLANSLENRNRRLAAGKKAALQTE